MTFITGLGTFEMGNDENGDLVVSKPLWAPDANSRPYGNWIVAPAARRPRGGHRATRAPAGWAWAIWEDGPVEHPELRLFILDLPAKEIINSSGLPLPPGAIRPPVVENIWDRDRLDLSWLAVAIDHQGAAPARVRVRDILVVEIATARIVERFQIDGAGDHLLHSAPPLPQELTPFQKEAFDQLRRRAIQEFGDEVVALIEGSDLAGAETLTLDAIRRFGSQPLNDAIETDLALPRIFEWSEFKADLIAADASIRRETGRPCALAVLGLFNRTGAADERLALGRTFYATFARDRFGRVEADQQTGVVRSHRDPRLRPIWIEGLEGVTALHRRSTIGRTEENTRQLEIDNLLAGLLVTIRVHRAVDACLAGSGLPCSVAILIQPDGTEWGMEVGVNDRAMPLARRFIEARPAAAIDPQTRAALNEREGEARREQAGLTRAIAQFREAYRMVRLFPAHRLLARRALTRQLDKVLEYCAFGSQFGPDGANWRMSQSDFEKLLRCFVEMLKFPVDEVLDPAHVDYLHEEWVRLGVATDFKYPPPENATPIELAMLQALRHGPILRERWERLGAYIR